MKHLKRQKTPKKWPTPRKGTKYIVKPNHNKNKGVPVLVVLRDILKIAQNRKEVKKALYDKNILLNGKIVNDEKNPLLLFDVISIVPAKKSFRLSLTEKGKFKLEEVKEKEAGQKISKIINKKTLKGKKTQINLRDGRNFLTDIKCNTGDSVLINFEKKKIEKCIPLKEKSKAIVFAGKHSGKQGIIEKLKLERKMAKLNANDSQLNVLIKQIMVVE